MSFNFLFGFTVFFILTLLIYQAFLWFKVKKRFKKQTGNGFLNKGLIKNWLWLNLFLIWPICIFIMIIFILITKNQIENVVWGYIYLVICFCFYILVISMITWETIAANSIFILVTADSVILLDNVIQKNNLVNIEINHYFHRLKYKHHDDNLHDVKTICTKPAAEIFKLEILKAKQQTKTN